MRQVIFLKKKIKFPRLFYRKELCEEGNEGTLTWVDQDEDGRTGREDRGKEGEGKFMSTLYDSPLLWS